MIVRSIGYDVPGWGGPRPGGGHTGLTPTLDAAVLAQAAWLEATYQGDVEVRYNADRRSGGAFLKDPVLGTTTIGLTVTTGNPRGQEELLYGMSVPGHLRALRVVPGPPPHWPHPQHVYRTAHDEEHARQLLQAHHTHPVYAVHGAKLVERDLRYGDIVISGNGYSDLAGAIVWRIIADGVVLQHKDVADSYAAAPFGTVQRVLRGLVVHDVRVPRSSRRAPRARKNAPC